MLKPLRDQVVVITGASSGIGREAALQFAKAGASVAIAARNEEALRDLEEQIWRQRGNVLAVPTDVSDWNQVHQLAQRVAVYFGRIDTWVNNAAVPLYGTFTEIPVEEFRRVIEVNLMGQVHGVKAALPYLQREGRGAIIGVASVMSQVPMPLQSAYVASTYALKGFYDTLRIELAHDRSRIQVSLIQPWSINTPFFDHALSRLGVKPAPVPPVYGPGLVTQAILRAASHPVRDLFVGGGGAALAWLERISPRLADQLLERWAFSVQRTDEPESPLGPNNLWEPMPEPGQIRGDFAERKLSPYTWLELHPRAAFAVAGALTLGLTIPMARSLWRSAKT